MKTTRRVVIFFLLWCYAGCGAGSSITQTRSKPARVSRVINVITPKTSQGSPQGHACTPAQVHALSVQIGADIGQALSAFNRNRQALDEFAQDPGTNAEKWVNVVRVIGIPLAQSLTPVSHAHSLCFDQVRSGLEGKLASRGYQYNQLTQPIIQLLVSVHALDKNHGATRAELLQVIQLMTRSRASLLIISSALGL